MLAYNMLVWLLFALASPFLCVCALCDFFQVRRRLFLVEPNAIDSRKSLWLHGASLGETGVIQKLLPGLRKKYPGMPIVVSSTTATANAYIEKEMVAGISHSVYLPFELPLSVRRAFDAINPSIVVIVETELWPNFIVHAKKRGARVVLVNGRLSDRSFPTYRFFRFFFRRVLASIDAIAVQNNDYYKKFLALGVPKERLSITGNIKQSMVLETTDSAQKESRKASLGIPLVNRVIIAASTRPGEEDFVLAAFAAAQKQLPQASLILAPRHLKRIHEVEKACQAAGMPFIKKSALDPAVPAASVIVLDTLGELSRLFAIADVAFVGGSLAPFGGHNLLEPLPFCVPVCFGPHCESQRESARLILENQCGAQVNTWEELTAFIVRMASGNEEREQTTRNIRTLLARTGLSLKSSLDLI